MQVKRKKCLSPENQDELPIRPTVGAEYEWPSISLIQIAFSDVPTHVSLVHSRVGGQ